jgi:hypothetical protein
VPLRIDQKWAERLIGITAAALCKWRGAMEALMTQKPESQERPAANQAQAPLRTSAIALGFRQARIRMTPDGL